MKKKEEEEIITRSERTLYTKDMRQLKEDININELPSEKDMPAMLQNEIGEYEGYFSIGGKYYPELEVRVMVQKKKVDDEYRKLLKMNKEALMWKRKKMQVLEDRKNINK